MQYLINQSTNGMARYSFLDFYKPANKKNPAGAGIINLF